MKNIIIVLFILFFSVNTFSQNDSITKKRYFLPLEISVQVNYTNKIGFGASIMSNIISRNNSSLLFGIKHAQYKFHFNHLKATIATVDSKTYYDINNNIETIEIPLLYRYKLKCNVFFNIGFSYGFVYINRVNSKYYKSIEGIFKDENKNTSYKITHFGNIIGGVGFQKLYRKYGFIISLNFMVNSLSLNINNQNYYYGNTPNLSNINLSVAFIIK